MLFRSDRASALVLTGFEAEPSVKLNGNIETNLTTKTINGERAFLVPLKTIVRSDDEIEKTQGK